MSKSYFSILKIAAVISLLTTSCNENEEEFKTQVELTSSQVEKWIVDITDRPFNLPIDIKNQSTEVWQSFFNSMNEDAFLSLVKNARIKPHLDSNGKLEALKSNLKTHQIFMDQNLKNKLSKEEGQSLKSSLANQNNSVNGNSMFLQPEACKFIFIGVTKEVCRFLYNLKPCRTLKLYQVICESGEKYLVWKEESFDWRK